MERRKRRHLVASAHEIDVCYSATELCTTRCRSRRQASDERNVFLTAERQRVHAQPTVRNSAKLLERVRRSISPSTPIKQGQETKASRWSTNRRRLRFGESGLGSGFSVVLLRLSRTRQDLAIHRSRLNRPRGSATP